jgi:hypothetical protein
VARTSSEGKSQSGPDLRIRLVQLIIDPADQVPVGNVSNEQVKAVGKLIQMAVSQPMSWQGTGRNVMRLGAGAARLFVTSIMKVPIGLQLRAAWPPSQILAD